MGEGIERNRTAAARGIGSRGINRLSKADVTRFLKESRTLIQAANMGGRKPPACKLLDGGGLFLQVSPVSGRALWRLKFRIPGKDSLLALGEYPSVSLEDARKKRDEAKPLIEAGTDPVLERQLRKVATAASADSTFSAVAALWMEASKSGWKASHYDTTASRIRTHLTEGIGHVPVATLGQSPAILQSLVIDPIVKNENHDTATKIRFIIRGVFRYARARGLFKGSNPADDLFIPRQRLKGRRPAFLEWKELGDVLQRARAANLSQAVHRAHRLCAFSAARIGNVIAAEWSEFFLGEVQPKWVIPREKMKAQDRHFPFTVILGPTIAKELREWHQLQGKPGRWVFPSLSDPDGFISHEGIEKAYRVTLGLKDKHTPHGWRSAFSTLAKESDQKFERDAVNMALDHVHDSEVARRYDRGERLPERVRLTTWWDEQLSRAERGGEGAP